MIVAHKRQDSLNKKLRFGSRNQNGGRHQKIELIKFLMAGDVLQRLARRAPLDHSQKRFVRFVANSLFGVCEQVRAVYTEQVAEQHTGSATCFIHAGSFELARAFVDGFGDSHYLRGGGMSAAS